MFGKILFIKLKEKNLKFEIAGKINNKIPIWMNACDVFVLPSLAGGKSYGDV